MGQISGQPRASQVAAATATNTASDPFTGSASLATMLTSTGGVRAAPTTPKDRTVRSTTVPSSSVAIAYDVTRLYAMWAAPMQ